MALVLNDRVKETTTTTGLFAITLAGAVTGFDSFSSGIGGSNETYYSIVHQTADEWEVGRGVLNSDASQIIQRNIFRSSNGYSGVAFSAGTKDVFCTFPAIKTMEMVLTTQGDMPYASAANVPQRLALGSAGQVLQVNSGGTAPEWASSSGVSAGFVIAMSVAL